jgi:hypothetical protein
MLLNMSWINRLTLMLGTLLLLNTSGIAQDETTPERRFSMGLKLGPMSSQMSGDGLSGFDKFGAVAGATLKGKINARNAFLIGMEFSPKGSRAPIDTLTHNTFAYRLNYIQLPFNWNFQWSDRMGMHLGGYAAYLISQSVMANKIVYSVNEYGGQPGFKAWDLGMNLGLDIVLNDSWWLQLDYGQSLLPIRNNPSVANQYSYYEQGNYNSTVAASFIRFF